MENGRLEKGTILQSGGKNYDAMLVRTDVGTGSNSFYKLQIIQLSSRYYLYRAWGKVGVAPNRRCRILDEFYNENGAKSEFEALFEDKTGNSFSSRRYQKVSGLYFPISTEYSVEEEVKDGEEGGDCEPCSLCQELQNFINLILDVKVLKKQMVQMEIDVEKMPLGNISIDSIKRGYEILSDLQQFITNLSTDNTIDLTIQDEKKKKKKKRGRSQSSSKENEEEEEEDVRRQRDEVMIRSFSNQFYSCIPHTTPPGTTLPLINSPALLQEKIELLDNLDQLKTANSLIEANRARVERSKKEGFRPPHPLDMRFNSLKCGFDLIDSSTALFRDLSKYLTSTHGPTHKQYKMTLRNLFEVDRENENFVYTSQTVQDNKKLLWHGSRITNFGGILSQG